MRRTLVEYLKEQETTHEFRLKLAVEPSEKQLDALELHLRKYDGFQITPPVKTIMQKHPKDFRAVKATEVWIIDFKTKLPAAPHHLVNELTQKMGINETSLIVRNMSELPEDEDDDMDFVYVPRIGDDDYSEAEKINPEDWYGDEFAKNFVEGELKYRAEDHQRMTKRS